MKHTEERKQKQVCPLLRISLCARSPHFSPPENTPLFFHWDLTERREGKQNLLGNLNDPSASIACLYLMLLGFSRFWLSFVAVHVLKNSTCHICNIKSKQLNSFNHDFVRWATCVVNKTLHCVQSFSTRTVLINCSKALCVLLGMNVLDGSVPWARVSTTRSVRTEPVSSHTHTHLPTPLKRLPDLSF